MPALDQPLQTLSWRLPAVIGRERGSWKKGTVAFPPALWGQERAYLVAKVQHIELPAEPGPAPRAGIGLTQME